MKKTIDNIKAVLKKEGKKCGKYVIAAFHEHLVLISCGTGSSLSLIALPRYLFKEQTEDYDSDWFEEMKGNALFYYFRGIKKSDGRIIATGETEFRYVWESELDKHVKAYKRK